MKAAVLKAPKVLSVEEIATPVAGPGELLVRVRAATVCGTDTRIFSGGKSRGVRFPSVLGHEFAGEVVDVGLGVTKFKTGDRVSVDPVIPCRSCKYCKTGRENVCANRQAIGYEFDGAFAEYVLIPAIAVEAGNVFIVPPSLSFEAASLAEPLACCINGMRNVQVRLGDTVVVLGAGPIGLMHAALAKLQGARRVIVSDPNDMRREVAFKWGASRVVNPMSESLADIVKEETVDGLGADVVIQAIGVPALANEALNLVCKGGRVNFFAGFPSGATATLDVNLIHYNEIFISGASGLSRRDYETSLGLLAEQKLDVPSLITHKFSIDEAETAFAEAASGRALKVAVFNE